MNNLLLSLLVLFSVVSMFSSCATTKQQTFSRTQQGTLESFMKNVTGVYDNKTQADTTKNPLLRLSEIRAFRIWTHKKDEYWISIGWYQPGVPEQPLGEKIFHIKSFDGEKYLVDCYSWKDPMGENMLVQWRKPQPYKIQTENDLVNDGCSNYLMKTAEGNFELKTMEGEICAFNNPMAPFDGLFFHFIFDDKGNKMDIHDINYKNEQVIFHYIDAPMEMRKVAAN